VIFHKHAEAEYAVAQSLDILCTIFAAMHARESVFVTFVAFHRFIPFLFWPGKPNQNMERIGYRRPLMFSLGVSSKCAQIVAFASRS
jgi:hypothetical protein